MKARRSAFVIGWLAACQVIAASALAQPAPGPGGRADSLLPAGTAMDIVGVLEVAIRQSPDLDRAVIDVDAARAQQLRAKGLDDWTVEARGNLTLNRLSVEGMLLPDVIADDWFEFGGRLSAPLRTGGTFELGTSARYIMEDYQLNDTPEFVSVDGLAAQVSAALFQPLLRGAGERIARAEQRRARIAHDVATLRQASEALALIREVSTAYWELAHTIELLKIRLAALELAREQLKITQVSVRNGAVAPTEEVAVAQAIAVREQAILLAEVEISQQSLALRRMAGLEIGPDAINVLPTSKLTAPGTEIDMNAQLQQAWQRNPLLALLEAQERGAEIDVEVTRDAIRPRLDVRAEAGLSARSDSLTRVPRQLGGFDNPFLQLTLTYEQQLGSHNARGEHELARTRQRRVKLDLEDARREVAASVVHSINLLRAGQKRIEVSQQAIDLAQQNLEIEQKRFLAGRATNFDVLRRQDELEQANVSHARAVVDTLAAQAQLEALTGDLLDRYSVRLDAPR